MNDYELQQEASREATKEASRRASTYFLVVTIFIFFVVFSYFSYFFGLDPGLRSRYSSKLR